MGDCIKILPQLLSTQKLYFSSFNKLIKIRTCWENWRLEQTLQKHAKEMCYSESEAQANYKLGIIKVKKCYLDMRHFT